MLYTIITSRLFVEKKGRFFSSVSENVQKLWNTWELRAAVLLSLLFQILLMFLGDKRRHIKKSGIQIILWIAYLCADWVAAVALGILSHSIVRPNYNELLAFWAPFLLLHLGGPDTITAFSLEDNELWLRHLLGLCVQGSVASYVSYRSWTGSMVSILSVMMYAPAILKYGERTWVLCLASKEHLRDSMLSPPDPGPNYAKFMEEYVSKDEEGFRVTIGRVEDQSSERLAVDQSHSHQGTHTTASDDKKDGIDDNDDAKILVKAHYFYDIFKRLFAFLILSFDDWHESKSFFQQISPQKAFKLIDFELGFMFDLLYTKATVVHSRWGSIRRSISLSLTVVVFAVFIIEDKKGHSPADIIITYLLLALAILLEIVAAIILISSDLALLWLTNHGLHGPANFILSHRCKRTRWSNSIAQYNLLHVWLKDKPTEAIRILRKYMGIDKKVKKFLFTSYKDVPEGLKELIFKHLHQKSYKATDFKEAKSLCSSRGSEVLKQKSDQLHDLVDSLGWSIVDVEFDQSVLIWHIATDLCYQNDQNRDKGERETCKEQRDTCKLLSDYMLYLLVVCPFMLPEGIGEIRYLDTEEETRNFFKEKDPKRDAKEACRLLLDVKTDIAPIEVKGPKSKSVLFDACRLAKLLETNLPEMKKKWETISLVWVEMLSYAAVQCKGPNHAQQLGQGGELLTHVWLLMAHLGITEQFQMPTGFARKLMYR